MSGAPLPPNKNANSGYAAPQAVTPNILDVSLLEQNALYTRNCRHLDKPNGCSRIFTTQK